MDSGKLIFCGAIIVHRWLVGYVKYNDPNSLTILHKQSNFLSKLVSSCASLREYKPSPYYYVDFHGQFQTVLQCVLRYLGSALFSNVRYFREVLNPEDNGTIALDWVDIPYQLSAETPIVLIHHGLCGDSNSEYIIHLAEKLSKSKYRVVVLIARGCGGLKLTSPVRYTGSRIEDLRVALKHVHDKYPNAKIFGIGFSLGAGILLKYVGTYPDSYLTSAISISPPWNYHLQTRVFPFWSALMVFSLKAYLIQNLGPYINYNIRTLLSILFASDLSSFDALNIKEYGYESLLEYYNDASPCFLSHRINIPTLAISSLDDPVCCCTGCPGYSEKITVSEKKTNTSSSAISYVQQDTDIYLEQDLGTGLVIVRTLTGGHLAFAEGWFPFRENWIDRVVTEWIHNLLLLTENETDTTIQHNNTK